MSTVLAYAAYAKKGVAAFIVTAVAGFGTAMLDGDLTGKESIAATGAALIAGAAVYKLTNGPKPGGEG